MISISSTMNATLSALTAQQAAIDITSSNIANASTDGYSRRQVVISSVTTGVTETSARRVYDAFLQNQLNDANQKLGKYDATAQYLDSVETIFNESDNAGLGNALSTFWNAWQSLASDPSSASARSILVSDAKSLATTFNDIGSGLDQVQANIDLDVVDTVSTINEDIRQIADLNRDIAKAKAAGQDTGTFQDSLDALVTNLSKLVDIKVYTNDNGQACIQLADGKPLVDGATAWSLSTATDAATGLQDITWVDKSGNASTVTSAITGAKLGGCLEVRDTSIPAYREKLDTLALSIINAVNALHTSGYDLNGTAGVSFFTGTGAADITVNPALSNDTDKIAASSSAGSTTAGSIATEIADLAEQLTLNSGTSSFSDYYSALVSEVGTDAACAGSHKTSQTTAVDTYQNLRDSVTSVSTDEEQTKLILYERSYEAAAKVMSVLDEILKTLIDSVNV